jgi:hypothetical protein
MRRRAMQGITPACAWAAGNVAICKEFLYSGKGKVSQNVINAINPIALKIARPDSAAS